MANHAILSPSSASRWLTCTPSARLEEGHQDAGSVYAQEGTLAHRLGELYLQHRFYGLNTANNLLSVRESPLYSGAMSEHMVDYCAFVEARMAEAKARCGDPELYIEKRIDISAYVPGSFGTADAVIIADGLMDVIDLKYGAGVPVSAQDNPQMMLYALGCLLAFSWAYDITEVRMTVYQPRLDNFDSAVISAEDLMAWAETELKPKAQQAWEGTGDFNPGDHQCRWCKAGATCRARAEYQLELARYDFAKGSTLMPDEIANILDRLSGLLTWAEQIKTYAYDQAVNHGQHYPGYKLVEGRSNRKYADEAAIAETLTASGFEPDTIFKPKELLGITAMESMVGKKKLAELVGQYIIKPDGAPTLVSATDKRPELNTAAKAAEDFKED